jgi:Zn-dependent peptidase ImmA (M78 family)
MKLEFYDDERCKRVANAFLESHGFLAKQKLPVNVELLALKSGHPVSTIEGLRSNFDMKGTVFRNLTRDRFEILLDARHYEQDELSAPFTIAEELGHILIHSGVMKQIETPEDRIDFEETLSEQTRRIFEMQAKKVGSALLLPSDLYDPIIMKWVEENLDTILKDNPYDEQDLSEFIATNIQKRVRLSVPILHRAMHRRTPIPLIHTIVENHGIKLLKNIPVQRIGQVKSN